MTLESLVPRSVVCFGLLAAGLGLAIATPTFAGSAGSNIPALKAQAAQAQLDLKKVDDDWHVLGTKLADRAFAARYEGAIKSGNATELSQHLQAAGFTFQLPAAAASPAAAPGAKPMPPIYAQAGKEWGACAGIACVALPANLAGWHERNKHAAVKAKIDAFLAQVATNEVLDKRIEHLIDTNDRKGLLRVLTEAGLPAGSTRVLTIDSDKKFYFSCWLFTISFEW
jgi:hypothetical protein